VDNVSPAVFDYCQRALRVATRRSSDTAAEKIRKELGEELKRFTPEEQHQIAEMMLKSLKQRRIVNKVLQGDAALRLLGITGQRRRLKAPRAPLLSQEQWDVEDLRALPEWPYSRPMTYKILHQMAADGKIKLNGLLRGRIDTTKRHKQTYTRFWISRKDKQIVEKEIFGR
jgi:hypothetical protein